MPHVTSIGRERAGEPAPGRRILIIGLNYAPERVGIGPYTEGVAERLVQAGHEVAVIAGKPYYPAWRTEPAFARPIYVRSVEDGVAVTRCPHYVPAVPSGARRIVHHLTFAMAVLPAAILDALRRRPDLVVVVVPSLLSVPIGRIAARIARARLWIHVQDFEVEAAFATGLMGAGSRGARLALGFEGRQLRSADRVSSISPQMCAKLADKGVASSRIAQLRNWAEIDSIHPLETASVYRAEWAIDRPHVALYSGNIANKQGIMIVIEAARLLAHRTDLMFVICGEGVNRANLEAAASGLGNVRIHDLQPAERLGELLGLATVHMLPQLPGAADLVLPSKLANMLASGRPVVATAAPDTGIAVEVEGCGIVTPPGDAPAFAQAVQTLIDDPAACGRFGRNARERAEIRWSRAALLDDFRKAAEKI